ARAGHDRVEVGVTAVADPRLRAVDDVTVVGALRKSAHGGRVGTGMRFRQAVRTEKLTREHVGQPLRLLLVGAVVGERKARERVHARADADARPRVRDLLEYLKVSLRGLVTATELFAVRQAQEPGTA